MRTIRILSCARWLGATSSLLLLEPSAALAGPTTLRWIQPAGAAASEFRVYKGPSPGTGDLVYSGLPVPGAGGVFSANVQIDEIDQRIPVYVWLTARNAAGESVPSNAAFFPGSNSSPPQGIFLDDDFSGADSSRWIVVDEGTIEGPSNWVLTGGEIDQSSNIYGPSGTAIEGRRGTFAYYGTAEALYWSNYSIDVTLRSSDDDGIGVLFYYRDPGNYYKLELDRQRNFRKLFKVVNGVETTLASESAGFALGADMLLQIEVADGQIVAMLDGALLFGFPVPDVDLEGGTVALYTWGNTGASFQDVLVSSLAEPPPPPSELLLESFDGSASDWTIVDEGTLEGPSNWAVAGGELVQSSNVYGPSGTATEGRRGTFVYYDTAEALAWSNYSVDVILRSSDDDGIGVLFCYRDPANYYKLDLDRQRNFRKLVQVVNGVETTLANLGQGYVQNQEMVVHIEVVGGWISVEIDGADLFGLVAASNLTSGTVGLYSWGNRNSYFMDVAVRSMLFR